MEQINNDILIIISQTGHVIFHITNISFKGTTEIIDASTKCGPDSRTGEKILNINLQGQEMVIQKTEFATPDLEELYTSKANISWKIISSHKGNHEGSGFIKGLGSGLIRISGNDSNHKYSVEILLSIKN